MCTPTNDSVKRLSIGMVIIGFVILTMYINIFANNIDTIGINLSGMTVVTLYEQLVEDLSLGLLLSIEMIFALILGVAGLIIVVNVDNKSNTKYEGTLCMFILNVFVMVVFAAMLGVRLMYIFGSVEGACDHKENILKACPVTRHLLVNDFNWTNEKTEPISKSDCIFWFWDSMQPVEFVDSISQQTDMEDYMDWGSRLAYTGDNLLNLQEKYNITSRILKKPDISSCWYWGCSEVCNHERFFVNRQLLIMSGVVFLCEFIFTIVSGQLDGNKGPWGNEKDKDESAEVKGVEPGQQWQPMSVELPRKRRLKF